LLLTTFYSPKKMKEFKFIIDGHKYEVSVEELESQQAEVVVNGTKFNVQIEKTEKEPAMPVFRRSATAAPQAVPSVAGKAIIVKSPLPGSIVNVLVTPGQSVKRGDTLLTMESMKMENQIKADQDGVVKTIFVDKGANVMQDDKLLELEGVATAAPAAPQPAPAPKPQPAAPKAEAKPAAAPVAGGLKVKSPLPGSVVRVPVSEGQSVKRGDDLVILESMKMENAIKADRDGVVKQILVNQGQNVMQDDVLVVLE